MQRNQLNILDGYKRYMTTTFNELKDHLKSLDEITLLEKLEINSEEIVDRFEDKIEEKQDQLLDEDSEDKEEEDES